MPPSSSDPKRQVSFPAAVALCALAFPLVVYAGTVAYPDLVAVVLYWMLPVVLPLSYLFPETVLSVTFLIFLSPLHYTIALGTMFLAWYGLGFLVGSFASRRRRPVLVAAGLLPLASAAILAAGYALAPTFEARLQSIAAT